MNARLVDTLIAHVAQPRLDVEGDVEALALGQLEEGISVGVLLTRTIGLRLPVQSRPRDLQHVAQVAEDVATLSIEFGNDLDPLAVFRVVRSGQAQQARHLGRLQISADVVGEQAQQRLDVGDALLGGLDCFLEKPKCVQAVAREVHHRRWIHELAQDASRLVRGLGKILEIDIGMQAVDFSDVLFATALLVGLDGIDAPIQGAFGAVPFQHKAGDVADVACGNAAFGARIAVVPRVGIEQAAEIDRMLRRGAEHFAQEFRAGVHLLLGHGRPLAQVACI
jgi:hypothetical protein